MPKHVIDTLTALGLPAEDAAKIDSMTEEDQATFDAKPYVEKVRANYQTQFKNDPAFFDDMTVEKLPFEVRKKIESAQYGRAANVMRDKVLKGLGMTEADIADLSDEQREKLELYIPAVAEKYAKTKAGDKQLQQELIEARKKLEGYNGYEEKIKGQYETEANQKITGAIFNANLIGELSAIPGLKVKASTLAREANEILNSKYAFERTGDYSVELRNKANPAMKVLKEGSSQELTLKEALLEIAEKEGWIEKPAEVQQKQSGKINVSPQNGELKMFAAPHIQDKISRKIATEK